MRWPWQPQPGMVRISHRKLIELLRGALRAADLEQEFRKLSLQTAKLEAEVHLSTTLSVDEREAVAALVDQPPLTTDGDLHEPAFVALVEATLEARRREQHPPLRVINLKRVN